MHRYSGSIINEKRFTSGYHENFLVPSIASDSNFFRSIMSSHFASRIWCGAGTIGENGFEVFQKVSGIGGDPISYGLERQTDHGNKPMALIRSYSDDRSVLGNNSEWTRLEVRFADPGFSFVNRYLSLAATSSVIRLAEYSDLANIKYLLDHSFKNPLEAAKEFNTDLTFSKTALTKNGRKISALDYQEILASACLELSDIIDLPQEEVNAIMQWLDICDSLRNTDLYNSEYGGLENILDLVARHY